MKSTHTQTNYCNPRSLGLIILASIRGIHKQLLLLPTICLYKPLIVILRRPFEKLIFLASLVKSFEVLLFLLTEVRVVVNVLIGMESLVRYPLDVKPTCKNTCTTPLIT